MVPPRLRPKLPFDLTPVWFGGDNHGFDKTCPVSPPWNTIFGDDMPFEDPYPEESFRTLQCINVEMLGNSSEGYSGADATQTANYVGPSTLYVRSDNGGMKLIATKVADTTSMKAAVTSGNGQTCTVNMSGSVYEPFNSRGPIHPPPIRWDLTINLTQTDTSLAYTVTGTRSRFPAMEVYMGSDPILKLPPRDVPFYGPYDPIDTLRALVTTENVSTSGVVSI
jgi:hypothetical protein